MKKLFLSLVALMVATVSFAQNTLVATLTHGDNISMYYGPLAIRDAHNAAQSGDVINLSGGAFQAADITKGVSIRGTGIDDANSTYIIGDFIIDIPLEDTGRLVMEGLRCTGDITTKGTLNNAYFYKSQFSRFNKEPYNNSSTLKNNLFAHCKITENFGVPKESTIQFLSCYVSDFELHEENSSALFMNCIINVIDGGSEGFPIYLAYSTFTNCIFFAYENRYTDWALPSTSQATNCVSISYSNFFGGSKANVNNKKASFEELFKDFNGKYSDKQTFELTEEAKKVYLGTDGTEVGMHGGILPYDPTPSYPQITKMNVANKTTADGKLSVEIEVSAAE